MYDCKIPQDISQKMNIVIDYDETYTCDRETWDLIIKLLQSRNHNIICCTYRYPNEDKYNSDVISDMMKHNIEIVYAAQYDNKFIAMRQAGYIPENFIWIDDNPYFICRFEENN